MPAPWIHTLLQWSGVAICIASLAAGLFFCFGVSPWAMLARPRRRSTPRCPGRRRLFPPWRARCEYNLTGIPRGADRRTMCPECGLRSRDLFRPRARPMLALLCLIPAQLAGYTAWATPRFHAEGWVGYCPTTILVLLIPSMEMPVNPTVPPASVGEHLWVAMDRRMRVDAPFDWQWRLALDVCGPALDPEAVEYSMVAEGVGHRAAQHGHLSARRHLDRYWRGLGFTLATRERWPEGEVVRADLRFESGSAHPWMLRAVCTLPDGDTEILHIGVPYGSRGRSAASPAEVAARLTALGPAPVVGADPRVHVRLEYAAAGAQNWRLIREWDEPIRVLLVPTLADAIEFVEDPSVAQILSSGRRPFLLRWTEGNRRRFSIDPSGGHYRSFPRGLSLAFDLEIRRNGVLVGTAEVGPETREFWLASGLIPVAARHPDINLPDPANWEVVFRGDPGALLADPSATKAWLGEARVELDVVTH